jgi:light-regulated signal transduction histidine kinase (bacteriophytochrome)
MNQRNEVHITSAIVSIFILRLTNLMHILQSLYNRKQESLKRFIYVISHNCQRWLQRARSTGVFQLSKQWIY